MKKLLHWMFCRLFWARLFGTRARFSDSGIVCHYRFWMGRLFLTCVEEFYLYEGEWRP